MLLLKDENKDEKNWWERLFAMDRKFESFVYGYGKLKNKETMNAPSLTDSPPHPPPPSPLGKHLEPSATNNRHPDIRHSAQLPMFATSMDGWPGRKVWLRGWHGWVAWLGGMAGLRTRGTSRYTLAIDSAGDNCNLDWVNR